jgi:hypothetical protein
MRTILKPFIIVSLLISSSVIFSSSSPIKQYTVNTTDTASSKIQVAILLDVSGSMDGLIEQAKAQLWNMVSVMGRARCNNISPQIEIALYEYGRTTNSQKDGYVKQISGFTSDLDQLSKHLFALTTNGGDEYCGHVMYTSLQELVWDPSKNSYKVIFIAGNEDFLQGNTSWTKACEEARKKGVIVNTIYCGDRMQGIKEHWNLNTECGTGSYTNINHGARIEDIPTPYDSAIFTLNTKLNATYIAYGSNGEEAMNKQQEVDEMNYNMNKSVAAARVAVKGNKGLYRNTGWDLVDAYESDSGFIRKVDMKTLPDNLKNISREQLKDFVVKKTQERSSIQKEIEKVNTQREAYLVTEKTKRASGNVATLESEIEKIIKSQAKRYNMLIE